MSFTASIWQGLKKTFDFKGLAGRRQYWFFALFAFLLQLVLGVFDSLISKATDSNFNVLEIAASVLLLVTQLSLTARRFHDAGISAKWLYCYLLSAIALFPAIPELVDFVQIGGTPSEAQILEVANAVGPLVLSSLVTGLFVLVVSLLPSRGYSAGNKYAQPTEGDIPIDELKSKGW